MLAKGFGDYLRLPNGKTPRKANSMNMEEMVKTLIETQIIQALNSSPEAIEKLVKAALSKPVDPTTGSFTTSYGSKLPYLDFLVGDEIRSYASSAVRKILAENSDKIEQIIREALSTKDVVDSFKQAIVGTVDQEWKIQVKFEGVKDRERY
jgi:hypothetical protein